MITTAAAGHRFVGFGTENDTAESPKIAEIKKISLLFFKRINRHLREVPEWRK
jgi:hypothetical protein